MLNGKGVGEGAGSDDGEPMEIGDGVPYEVHAAGNGNDAGKGDGKGVGKGAGKGAGLEDEDHERDDEDGLGDAKGVGKGVGQGVLKRAGKGAAFEDGVRERDEAGKGDNKGVAK